MEVKWERGNYHAKSALYLRGYVLLVTFFCGDVREVDFTPALKKYGKGYYAKFKKMKEFKKFKVEDGNITWGKNWDLIFTPESVYQNKF